MAQTASNIVNVSSSATFNPLPVSAGGGSSLSVSFDVYSRGPNHLAGLLVTTDSWATSETVSARFVQFTGNGEIWNASFNVNARVSTFEFVVFCDDLGGNNVVPRIWNTNGGSVFQVNPTEI